MKQTRSSNQYPKNDKFHSLYFDLGIIPQKSLVSLFLSLGSFPAQLSLSPSPHFLILPLASYKPAHSLWPEGPDGDQQAGAGAPPERRQESLALWLVAADSTLVGRFGNSLLFEAGAKNSDSNILFSINRLHLTSPSAHSTPVTLIMEAAVVQ